ncbi:MAG: hypothetical protein IJO91_11700 [Oscillospiraceae bacterium]|nr:hypothetical protein [Oscillospiraceae bacterium]
MRRIKNLNSVQKTNLITAVLIYVFVLVLNFRCEYITDDWHFNFIWETFMPTADVDPVQNFEDIIVSMNNYYMMSGGRVLCHFLAYVMMCFDKCLFNVINALFFVLLGYLCYVHTKNGASENKFRLPLIYLSLLLFLPQFGDTCLWLSGSVNYLWPTVILLACFFAINRYAKEQSIPNMVFLYVSVALSSVTNETTAGMVIIFMLITFGMEHRKISFGHIPPFILAIAGMLMVILAPGNFNRANNIEKISIFDINNLFSTIYMYLVYVIRHYHYLLVIILFSVCVSCFSKKKFSEIVICNKYFITGFLGIIALSLLGFLSERPIFLGMVPIIVGAVSGIMNIIKYYCDEKQSASDKVLSTLPCVAIVMIVVSAIAHILHYIVLSMAVGIIIAGVLMILVFIVIRRSTEPSVTEAKKKIASLSERVKKLCDKVPKFVVPCVLIVVMIIPVANNTVLYFDSMERYSALTDEIADTVFDDDFEITKDGMLPDEGIGIFYPLEALKWGDYQICWVAMNNGIYIEMY